MGLEGMPQRLFACTPSRLAAFEDCPRRYRMTYLDRPAPPKGAPWAHNSLGASVHNVLRAWWDLPRARRTPAAAAALLRAAWIGEGYRDRAQQDAARQQAERWLVRYLEEVDPAAEPVAVERTVAARTATLAGSGRVDRVDERGEELVVVDYKTGRSELSADHARGSRALALYALATRRTLRRPCRRVELHHLPTGTVHAWEHTEASLERHVRRAEETAADIVAAEGSLRDGADPERVFPPRTGAGCGWCDLRRHCPEGQAAAPARDPWAGLGA